MYAYLFPFGKLALSAQYAHTLEVKPIRLATAAAAFSVPEAKCYFLVGGLPAACAVGFAQLKNFIFL